MAYETGAATDPNDMLIKLRNFAVAQGWTASRDVVAGSGRELCINKGSAYFNLRSYQNETMTINGSISNNKWGIALSGSDGYSAGAAWDLQPGYPVRASSTGGDQGHANLPLPVYQGPFPSYHLLTPNANCLYLELEVTSTAYQRLGFGSLDLFNSASPGGGRFFYASGGLHPSASWLTNDIDNPNYALEEVPFRAADYSSLSVSGAGGLAGSFLRASFDAFDNWCGSGRAISRTTMKQACIGGGVHDKLIRDLAPNPLNGVGVLVPNVVSVLRGDTFLNPVGIVPGMRYVDMSLYQPAEEFTLGPDTWKVFPWYQKGGRSYNRGIAYKKVT